MSQIMRGSLLSLSAALLLLLPWFDGLAVGEVRNGFKDCLRFFYNRKLPTGLVPHSNAKEYQSICQRYEKEWRFATLYHKKSRTPLFSAYILSPSNVPRPKIRWMYEPQLADPNAKREMQPFPNPVPDNVIESQAVCDDYKDSGVTRGHLAPSSHHNTKGDKEATFTLTNIVPQEKDSNERTWKTWEEEVERRSKSCSGSMYVITGVIPYKSYNDSTHWINSRVSVPEYIWSAYCCPKYKPTADTTYFPTYAAVGRNDANSGDEIVPKKNVPGKKINDYNVREMSLKTLEKILRKRLNEEGNVSLFDSECAKPKNP